MQVRVLTIIALLALFLTFTLAELLEPTSFKEATQMLEDNKHNIVTLVFVDPTVVNFRLGPEGVILEQESTGFFSNILGSVSGLFSPSARSIADMISELSVKNIVIQ